ncbi:MAG: nicotinate-nucleotide--dimethylbenzimidazole phosphoribosyltransferase [Bacteroidetes bacterium]|nr:MAG: nicotinate-nucleotide--dimethylbenzimidazole phosphoribosyltransferase [Bacteroidota bacterium]
MSLAQQVQHLINTKTKPAGALGRLEALALQLALVQNTTAPQIINPQVVVFAADHGIAAQQVVNAYPQAVTAQMVHNFLQGGAAINVFCNQSRVGLLVVDAGVNAVFAPHPKLVDAKVAMGTQHYGQGPAMLAEQLAQAKERGQQVVEQLWKQGCNTIALGEMGIGNTSSAALIMHQLCGLPLQACVGLGAGHTASQFLVKQQTLAQVAQFHGLGATHMPAEALLQRVGGFEIAMMFGAYLKAYELGMVMVIDGFIATSALLCAHQEQPAILTHCVFAHGSAESGHAAMLDFLGAQPLLQLGLRLGEGTGAVLALPLLQQACAFLSQMASFESAGIANA